MDTTRNYSGRGTVACYFRDPSQAEKAVQELSRLGVPKQDIGIAISEAEAKRGGNWTDRLRSMFSPAEREEYVGESDFDTLRDMGLSETDTGYYNEALRSGGALVTVNRNAPNSEKALSVLGNCGAVMPGEIAAERPPTGKVAPSEHHRIQLLGELLRVHKDRVQRGAVSVRKEVVSDTQTVEVPVTREELVVERHPATGTEPVRGGFEQGKEIRVPLSEEQVRVEKRPVVREEVEVGKRQVQDKKKVSDTVKHEEVDIKSEGDVKVDDKKKRTA